MMTDPFGVRHHVANSALSTQHLLAPDIYEILFDKVFFEAQVYTVWSQGDRPWALHCYGDPGCGKTTLAAIAVKRLRARDSSKIKAPVASIFIEKDVSTSNAVFLEDLLACVLHQLPSTGQDSKGDLNLYDLACRNGESISKRTKLLRIALASQLGNYDHTFLVLDGYDRVDEGLQVLLDREFEDLRAHRLRVMLTRRVPSFELPNLKICDGLDQDGEECDNYDLQIYWSCKACKTLGISFDLCYDYEARGHTCPNHGNAHLVELYDHVSIQVNEPDDLEAFVRWDLTRSLGIAHFHSKAQDANVKARTPLTSSGPCDDAALILPVTADQLRDSIKPIMFDKNIAIAKLYLDNIYKQQSFDVVRKVSDRLPRNIIAFFDAGIDHIRQQPRHEADIALLAIAAASEDEYGVYMTTLEEWMRDALSRLPHLASAPPRSLEDILRCANGFILEAESDDDHRLLKTYSTNFRLYVKENYNETLFWARSQLNIRRVSRAATTMIVPKTTSPPMVASPPSMDGAFDPGAGGMNQQLRESPPEYFDRSFSSGNFRLPPRTKLSLPDFPRDTSAEFRIKKLSPRDRTLTTVPTRKRTFQSEIAKINEEKVPGERLRPLLSRSIHRVCAYCEVHMLGSGKLFGTYERLYSSLNPLMLRKCIFCSALYKDFLGMSDAALKRLVDDDSPFYHWTIRTTAKSRESKNSIVVSFSPMLRPREREKKITKSQGKSATSEHEYNNVPTASAVDDSRIETSSTVSPNVISPRRFHLISDNDLGQIPTKDDVGFTTDPSNKAVGLQITKWIDECNKNHPKCIKAAKTTWVPTRLLDLQYGDGTSIRLIKTREEGIKGPYVTLSHCWGPPKQGNLFLTTQGEKEHLYKTQGIKIGDLKSTNFEQAISLTRYIGIRYVWIDSLCIIQGPLSDFNTEGQLMHKVYRNSYCNFAAADSVDSRGGLFRKRDPTDVLPGMYRGDGSSAIFGTTTWRIAPDDLWETQLLDTSIYTRGWVFQERMLSPRLLHFAHNQIFWDCGTLSACETVPSGLPLALDDAASTDRHWRGRLQESSSLAHAPLSGANDDSLGRFWSSAVSRYTQCNLTSQSDKSVAIWSVAKLVRDAWSDDYGVGMWNLALEEQLGWKVADTDKSIRSLDLQWRQPSWSWTSVQGAVSLPARVVDERCYRVKDHDYSPVQFSTWEIFHRNLGSKRPVLEKKHSGSIEEDLKRGFNEWERKTVSRTPSEPQIKDLHQGRSQSMPAGPDSGNKSATTGSESTPQPIFTDPKDLEPELESKSLAICAPVTAGTLHYDVSAGAYTFSIRHDNESDTGESNLLLEATTNSDHPSIVVTAYPDAVLTPTNFSPNTLNFVPSILHLQPNPTYLLILSATEHKAKPIPAGLGIDLDDDDYASDNEPDLPRTYSGTGILITPTSEYMATHDYFVNEIMQAEARLADAEDLWPFQNARKELDGLGKWFGEMWQEGHWRRIGAAKFEDWSEEDWESVMGREIWDVMRIQEGALRPRADGMEAEVERYPETWGKKFWLD